MIKPARKAVYDQLKNTDVTNEELLSALARAETTPEHLPINL